MQTYRSRACRIIGTASASVLFSENALFFGNMSASETKNDYLRWLKSRKNNRLDKYYNFKVTKWLHYRNLEIRLGF